MAEDRERLNTKLEWQGAEFLVLAHLLIEKIEAYKPYVNHPAYDLVALNPRNHRMTTISVKSRWATNRAGFFSLDSIDCDFVVHVALNRGERKKMQSISSIARPPQIYVFPTGLCAAVRGTSGRINMRNINDWESFENNWASIQAFLSD